MKFKILEGKVELFRRKDSKIILAGVCGIWEKDTQVLKIYTGNSLLDWTQNTITIKTVEGIDVLEITREGEDLSGENILIDLPFNYVFTVEVNGQQEVRTLNFEADIETEIVDTEYLESNGKTVSTCLADLVVAEELVDIFVDNDSWRRYNRTQRKGDSLVSPYLDEYGRIVASEYSWDVYEEFSNVSLRGGFSSYFGEVPFIELTGFVRKKTYKHSLGDTVVSTSLVSVKETPGIEIEIQGNKDGITIDNKNLRVYFDWNVVDKNSIFYISLKSGKLLSNSVTFGYVGGDIVIEDETKTSALYTLLNEPVFVFQPGIKHSIYLVCKSLVPTNRVSISPDKFDISVSSGALDSGGYLAIEFGLKPDVELENEEARPELFEVKIEDTTIYRFRAYQVDQDSSVIPISLSRGDSAIYVDSEEGCKFGLITSRESYTLRTTAYIPSTDYSSIFANNSIGNITGDGKKYVRGISSVNVVPSWECIDIRNLSNGEEKTYYLGSGDYTVLLPSWAHSYKKDDSDVELIHSNTIEVNFSSDCTYTILGEEESGYSITLDLVRVTEGYEINTSLDSNIPKSAELRQIGILYITNDGTDLIRVYKMIPIYLRPDYKIDDSIGIDFQGNIDPWLSSEINMWKQSNQLHTYTVFDIVLNSSISAPDYSVDPILGSDSSSSKIKYECNLLSNEPGYIELDKVHYDNGKIYISAEVKSLPEDTMKTVGLEVIARCNGVIIDKKSATLHVYPEFQKIEFYEPGTSENLDYEWCNPSVTIEEVKCSYYVMYSDSINDYQQIMYGDNPCGNFYSTKTIISSRDLDPSDIVCYAQYGTSSSWKKLKTAKKSGGDEISFEDAKVSLQVESVVDLAAGLKKVKYIVSYIPAVVADGFPVHPMKMQIGSKNLYMFFLPLNPYIRGYRLCIDNDDWVNTIPQQIVDVDSDPGHDQSNNTKIGYLGEYIIPKIVNPYFTNIKTEDQVRSRFNLNKLSIVFPNFFSINENPPSASSFITIDNDVYPPSGQSSCEGSLTIRPSSSDKDYWYGAKESIFPNFTELGIPSNNVGYNYYEPSDIVKDYLVRFVASDSGEFDPAEPVDFMDIFPSTVELNPFGEENKLINGALLSHRPWDILWEDPSDPNPQLLPEDVILGMCLLANPKIITVDGKLNDLSLSTTSTFDRDQDRDSDQACWQTTVSVSVGSRYSSSWIGADIVGYELEQELHSISASVLMVGDEYRYTGYTFYQPYPEWFVKTGDRVFRLFLSDTGSGEEYKLPQNTPIELETGPEGGNVSFSVDLYSDDTLWGCLSMSYDSVPFIEVTGDAAAEDLSCSVVSGGITAENIEINNNIVSVSIPAMTSSDDSDKDYVLRFTYTYTELDEEVPVEGESEGEGESSAVEVEKRVSFDYIIKQKYNPLQILTTADPSIYSFGVGMLKLSSAVEITNIVCENSDIDVVFTAGIGEAKDKLFIFPGSNLNTRTTKDFSIPLIIKGKINNIDHIWNQTINCRQGCFDIYLESNNHLVFNRYDPGDSTRVYVPRDYDNVDIIPKTSEMEVNLGGTTYTGAEARAIVENIDVSLVIDGSNRNKNYPYIDSKYTLAPKYEGRNDIIIKLPVEIAIETDDCGGSAKNLIELYGSRDDVVSSYSKTFNIQIKTN